MITMNDIIEKYENIKSKNVAFSKQANNTQEKNELEKSFQESLEQLKTENKKKLPDFFKKNFPEVFEMFEKEGYVPETFDEANIVFKAILDLDKQTEIKTLYAKSLLKPNELTEVKINKDNFYIGYQSKIWKNLSVKERAQVLKWHFDYKKEQIKDKDLSLRLIVENGHSPTTNGYTSEDDKVVYVNPLLLFKELEDSSFEIAHVLEHEFEHIKQFKLKNYIKIHKPEKMNLYEKNIYNRLVGDYIIIPNINYDNKLFYYGDLNEQVANKRAIKNIEKYMADPKYQDIFDENEKEILKYYKTLVYFTDYNLTPEQVSKTFDISKEELAEYTRERNFIKQMPTICKFLILRDLYVSKIESIISKDDDIKKEITRIKRDVRKDFQNEQILLMIEESPRTFYQMDSQVKDLYKKCNKINDYLEKIVNDEKFRLKSDFFDELNLAE